MLLQQLHPFVQLEKNIPGLCKYQHHLNLAAARETTIILLPLDRTPYTKDLINEYTLFSTINVSRAFNPSSLI